MSELIYESGHLAHYAKGSTAKKHKYLYIDANGNYVYKDRDTKESLQKQADMAIDKMLLNQRRKDHTGVGTKEETQKYDLHSSQKTKDDWTALKKRQAIEDYYAKNKFEDKTQRTDKDRKQSQALQESLNNRIREDVIADVGRMRNAVDITGDLALRKLDAATAMTDKESKRNEAINKVGHKTADTLNAAKRSKEKSSEWLQDHNPFVKELGHDPEEARGHGHNPDRESAKKTTPTIQKAAKKALTEAQDKGSKWLGEFLEGFEVDVTYVDDNHAKIGLSYNKKKRNNK